MRPSGVIVCTHQQAGGGENDGTRSVKINAKYLALEPDVFREGTGLCCTVANYRKGEDSPLTCRVQASNL